MLRIYTHQIRVGENFVDENGHVNNVTYIQWMQDVATMHSEAQGCTREFYQGFGSSWVVRSHQIEYLRPAFSGDELVIETWVSTMQRTRSLRRYRFSRVGDQALIAAAQTDWVYINRQSGRPRSIDPAVAAAFDLLPAQEETPWKK